LGLLARARAPVQLAEREVAVGDERPHAEFRGQIEGFTTKALRPRLAPALLVRCSWSHPYITPDPLQTRKTRKNLIRSALGWIT